MNVRPLKDRLVCTRAPIRNPSPILGPGFKEISTDSSGVEMNVLRVGPDAKEVVAGDVVVIANARFAGAINYHMLDGEKCYLFHESDLDGIMEG